MGEITAIFDQLVELYIDLKMVKGEEMFYDDIKIRANASIKHSKKDMQQKREIM